MTVYNNYQPGVGLTQAIALNGAYPSRDFGGGGASIATIHTYAFDFAPGGTAYAAGQAVPIQSNPALFSLIGTYYGGDGVTMFGLPDLRGTVAVAHAIDFGAVGEERGSPLTAVDSSNLPTDAGGLGTPVANDQPTLTTTFAINAFGIFPNGDPSPIDIGMVSQFAGTFAPNGMIPCDGRLLSIAEYDTLYAVVGTTYGGDGVTTFAVPDLRGRMIVGVDQTHQLGEMSGSDSVTLTQQNLPVAMGGMGLAVSNDAPEIALRYLICTGNGIYPSRDGGAPDSEQPFLGEILTYAGSYVPEGYVECDGRLLSIMQNQALFSLLGDRFGGDGVTTFALPDLGGRSVVGTGAAPGMSPVALGDLVGTESFTIGIDDFGPLSIVGTIGDDSRWGANQDDVLKGLGGDDHLYGNGGNDQLSGMGGYDTLEGGAGDDQYFIRDRVDTVIERAGGGDDTVVASVTHTLSDNVERLLLDGGATINGTGNALGNVIRGNDALNILTGAAGDDVILGNAGDDRLFGDDGDDNLRGGDGADAMTGGVGNDILAGDSGDDVIRGGEGQDLVDGGTGADRLSGDAGDDRLNGGDGDDRVMGGAGDDKLTGGTGLDVLTGEEGADTFVFAPGDFAGLTAGTADRITDFSVMEGDRIGFGRIDADALLAGDQAFDFIGTAGFSGAAGELRYGWDGRVTLVEGDLDGDGAADLAIRIDGQVALTAFDFNGVNQPLPDASLPMVSHDYLVGFVPAMFV